ncbi:bZIP transcription factor [Apiospora arundinis]
MEDPSHFFNYTTNDVSDGEYHMLDDSGADSHDYDQYFPASTFPTSENSTVPIRPQAVSAGPSTDSSSSISTHAYAQSEMSMPSWTAANQDHGRHLRVPSTHRAMLESPGLSSGSSTTPDTRHSQAITPENRRESRNVSIQPKIDAVFPPPPPIGPMLPPRRRRPRKPKPKPQLSVEEEEAKKNKTLERNRVAASKCREKKKDWTKDLEETKIGLESQNSHLKMEYSTLVNEVGEIRAQLMTHASCHDANIDKWLENEAKRFVLGAGDRYDAMLGAGSSSNLEAAEGSMPASAYGASGNKSHFDSSTYQTSLLPTQNAAAAIPSSPDFFQSNVPSTSGFQANSNNDDFANHMTQHTSSRSFPHIAVNPGSPSVQGSISNDAGSQFLADAAFSYGAFQADQEETPNDNDDLSFPHGII